MTMYSRQIDAQTRTAQFSYDHVGSYGSSRSLQPKNRLLTRLKM